MTLGSELLMLWELAYLSHWHQRSSNNDNGKKTAGEDPEGHFSGLDIVGGTIPLCHIVVECHSFVVVYEVIDGRWDAGQVLA